MGQDYAIHYVCTHEEARKLAFAHNRFWVSNCGCREKRGQCSQSRIDICMIFRGDIGASGSGQREIALTDILSIFDEAAEKRLVTRPYRNDVEKDITDGICFCCGDCCDYFTNPEERCDKGKLIESTDMDQCNYCGDCVPVCHFNARRLSEDELVVSSDNCYGCGICADVCPEKAVSMVERV